jgi:hypothetical protein
MKIESDQFYFHLGNELAQMKNNPAPNAKIINTIPAYKQVGDLEVGLYFIPNEMKYSTGGKLADSNGVSYVDPNILFDAADKVVMYTPDFREQKIFADFLEDRTEGRTRIQYCRSASFPVNTPVTYYVQPELPLEFSFMMGEGLRIIDRPGSGDLLGTPKIEFANVTELTKNFAVFVSMPLGNSLNSTEAYLASTTSGRHGVAVVVRGDISRLKVFVELEGVSFNPTATLPVSLLVNDRYDQNIYLTWTEERSVIPQYKLSADSVWTSFNSGQVVTGKSFSGTGPSRGNKYDYRLVDAADSTTVMAVSENLYYTDFIITEICFWGSSYYGDNAYVTGANDDDWLEIRNISGTTKALNGLEIWRTTSGGAGTPAQWIVTPFSTDSLDASKYMVVACRDTNPALPSTKQVFFDLTNYGRPGLDGKPGVFYKKTTTGDPLSSGHKIELRRGGDTIFTVYADDDLGGKAPYKTMVLGSDANWKTSENDIATHGTNMDFCSPGFAATGEY